MWSFVKNNFLICLTVTIQSGSKTLLIDSILWTGVHLRLSRDCEGTFQ